MFNLINNALDRVNEKIEKTMIVKQQKLITDLDERIEYMEEIEEVIKNTEREIEDLNARKREFED